MNRTIEEPYRSLNQFWAPAEKNFLSREREARRAAEPGEEANLPAIRVATHEELARGMARIREAMTRFREVMGATPKSIQRDQFREVQKFYYSLLRIAQALGRGAYELTGDADLARGWIGALMRTPEFKAFGRISDRFRQQTPKYRAKKKDYDQTRNALPEVRALRQSEDAKERINRNARIRYHVRQLRRLMAQVNRQIARGASEQVVDAARTEMTRRYTTIQELRGLPERVEDRHADCERKVDEFVSTLRRVA